MLGLALARDQTSYFAAWVVPGMGMRDSFYDAAFVALVQAVPSGGSRTISYPTLWGAYAPVERTS
jgi:hypothetical protein